MPTGNHGKSDFPYINWSKETRHSLLIQIKKLERDSLDKENYETIDGTIEWESQADIGQLLIEVLIATVITGAIFILVKC